MTGKMTHYQLSTPELIRHALRKNEGVLSDKGAFCAHTGKYTGRSPKDKFIVKDSITETTIDWGAVNQPMSEESFHVLYQKVKAFSTTKELYVFNGFLGADTEHRLPIQIITEYAWHNLFAKQLFVRATEEELQNHTPAFTVLSVPSFLANPTEDDTHSEAFIVTSFKEKIVVIGGTEYAGEIKKSLFGVMNFLLPQQGHFPMHCGSNMGDSGDVALFFGLSGTGKTTLSSDPNRFLIGDDEHGWTNKGIFNFEGGCYAKVINLNPKKEPDIYGAIRFGSVLENVVVNHEGTPDFDDNSLTENTRVAYPIDFISNSVEPSIGNTPQTIFFLTADAFGVLPPISKLTKEQAMYFFLNGYTSKLAGTERGITKPEATFSACFGSPFLPLHPHTYTTLLGEKLAESNADVYLINTGWGAGGYGKSERINLTYTRAMISAALSGELKKAFYQKDKVFGLSFPTACSNVPSDLLNPTYGWDLKEYEHQANALHDLFKENYKKMTF